MSRLIKVLFVSILFLLASCSWDHFRGPSSDNEIKFSGLIEIPHYGGEVIEDAVGESSEEFVQKVAQGVTSKLLNKYGSSFKPFTAKAVSVESLPNNLAYLIQTHVTDDGTHEIRIYQSKKYPEKSLASIELKTIMDKVIINTNNFNTPLAFFELMYNAKKQDPVALLNVERVRKLALEDLGKRMGLSEETKPIKEELDKQIDYNTTRFSEAEKRVKEYKREYKKKETARKNILDVLDKVENDEQFRTLIQKNDRVGTAELIEKYLPREQMTPMEHTYWNFILHKMKNPAPLEDRVLMYRGTGGDRLYPAIVDGVPLEYEDAVKESKLVALSTVINRNQGTWNRRLRSLQTMYGKNFSMNSNNKKGEFNATSRIANWMSNHAASPEGSPFLSLTPSMSVAVSFARKSTHTTVAAYAFDPEILLFNQMSGFEHEMEYLLPLLNFPDEMLGYYDNQVDELGKLTSIEEFLKQKIIKKVEAEYGAENGKKVYAKMKALSKEFKNQDKAYLVPQIKEKKIAYKVEVEVGWFRKLMRKIFRKKGPVYKTLYMYEKYSVGIKDVNNCLYLIKSFNNK